MRRHKQSQLNRSGLWFLTPVVLFLCPLPQGGFIFRLIPLKVTSWLWQSQASHPHMIMSNGRTMASSFLLLSLRMKKPTQPPLKSLSSGSGYLRNVRVSSGGIKEK